MHHFLPVERLDIDSPGNHHAKGSRQSGVPQPNPQALAGNLPAESALDFSGLGRGAEPAARRGINAHGGAGSPSVDALRALTRLSGRAAAAAKSAALGIIHAYRLLISPALPSACRFEPTCSAYALEAIEKWGLRRGAWLSLRRLLRCHPLGRGGYDPVPKATEVPLGTWLVRERLRRS